MSKGADKLFDALRHDQPDNTEEVRLYDVADPYKYLGVAEALHDQAKKVGLQHTLQDCVVALDRAFARRWRDGIGRQYSVQVAAARFLDEVREKVPYWYKSVTTAKH